MDEPPPEPLGPEFSVEVTRAGATARVLVRGELDLLTAPELQRTLEQLLAGQVRHIVLDLRELEFIDSTGVRVVYWLDQCSRQDGFNAAIVRGQPPIQRVFTVAGFSDRFVFVDRPEDLRPPAG